MPIKGMTDQKKRFVRIGHLRKGEPKPEGQVKPGRDLEYFRFDPEPGEEEAAAAFHAAYGAEPKEINIVLPFDEVEENLEAWHEAYLAGGLVHRCTSEYVEYAIDPESGEALVKNGLDRDGERVKCDGEPVAHWTDRKGNEHPVFCEPVGRLDVIIPELRRIAYITVHTTSKNDIVNLSGQLEGIRDLNDQRLRGIPLVLKRSPKMISTPGGEGKRIRRESWLLSVEPDRKWVEAQLETMKAAALPNGYLLSEPEEATIIEAEVVSETESAAPKNTGQPNSDAPANMADLYEEAEAKLGIAKPDAVQTLIAFLEAEHGNGATIKSYVDMAGPAEAASCLWRILKESLEPRQEEIPF